MLRVSSGASPARPFASALNLAASSGVICTRTRSAIFAARLLAWPLPLRGISITLIADATDTSEREIRRHYAKLISDHSGEIMRRALLDVSPPPAANVVAFKG